MSETINHNLPPLDAFAIDASVAQNRRCSECGGECRYDSHYEETRGGGHIYRAYSVCKDCGHRVEF